MRGAPYSDMRVYPTVNRYDRNRYCSCGTNNLEGMGFKIPAPVERGRTRSTGVRVFSPRPRKSKKCNKLMRCRDSTRLRLECVDLLTSQTCWDHKYLGSSFALFHSPRRKFTVPFTTFCELQSPRSSEIRSVFGTLPSPNYL